MKSDQGSIMGRPVYRPVHAWRHCHHGDEQVHKFELEELRRIEACS
jgi:hypothetical protein